MLGLRTSVLRPMTGRVRQSTGAGPRPRGALFVCTVDQRESAYYRNGIGMGQSEFPRNTGTGTTEHILFTGKGGRRKRAHQMTGLPPYD
jgi:hypothetical protein